MSGRYGFNVAGMERSSTTPAQHYSHRHHHVVPAAVSGVYPTLAAVVDRERNLLPVPVIDCACVDGRLRPPSGESRRSPGRCDFEMFATSVPDSTSFKDVGVDRLLRMPDAVVFPVADSAVNYGLEETGTGLRAADVCRSCCAESLIT